MIKRLAFIFWIALIGVATMSCEGEKGDVGPVGPAGPKGETGAPGQNGTNGTNGQNGEDGIGAREITVGAVKTTRGGYTTGKAGLSPADTILIDKSVVVVFIKSQNSWWAQPGIVRFANNAWTNFTVVTLRRGPNFFVDIRPVSWSEQQDAAPERDLEGIRVVIIPAEKLRTNASVDMTNYDELVSTLGLTKEHIWEADL